MIVGLIIDLDGAKECPADTPVMGRTLAAYPLISAQACKQIKRHYLVTDSPPVKAVGLQYDAVIIDPPQGETHPDAAARVAHGWRFIKDDVKTEGSVKLVALLFAHAAAITTETLDQGIDLMLSDPRLDSAMTVTRSGFCHPRAAFREDGERLAPFITPAPAPQEAWFPDLAATVLRPRCLDAMGKEGPFPWLGANVLPLKRDGTCPVDHRWQMPLLAQWLKDNGVPDLAAVMEPQPKPQPQPKQDRR
ncbi:MAG: hypothetical protein HY924_17090 [Elusimicrobia bacterium]|nr:hypothetical protein [Elusimicrobiota bacterium]